MLNRLPPTESARGHHEQGQLQFSLGRYETAISEFRKAYELRADPSFLFDIAEAYRSLGAPERAVFFYRRYLTTHPNPPNRPEVEARIALIEPSLPPNGPSGPISLHPRPDPSASAAMLPSPPPKDQIGLRDTERSMVGRWWFWTAIGTLAAVGATLAILALASPAPRRCRARTSGTPSFSDGACVRKRLASASFPWPPFWLARVKVTPSLVVRWSWPRP